MLLFIVVYDEYFCMTRPLIRNSKLTLTCGDDSEDDHGTCDDDPDDTCHGVRNDDVSDNDDVCDVIVSDANVCDNAVMMMMSYNNGDACDDDDDNCDDAADVSDEDVC